MGRYILRRLGGVAFVVLALIVFTFFAVNVLGDPIALLADPETTRPEDIELMRKTAGLDRSLPVRFWHHLVGTLQGDFGQSLFLHRPAGNVVLERVPATLALALITILFSVAVSVLLSVISVRSHGSPIARFIFLVSTALACLPSFWLAILLILLLAVRVQWFPTGGYGYGLNLVLPVLSLSAQPIGYFTQVLTAGMREQVTSQHVRVARAKGLGDTSVLINHVLRNTSILATTMVGSMIASLVNGAVLAESIFAWPGIGNMGLTAVQNRDLPVLTAVIFYAGLTVTLINLVVDLVYMRLDPRIRLK